MVHPRSQTTFMTSAMSTVKLLVFALLVGAVMAQDSGAGINATKIHDILCKIKAVGDIVFLVDDSGSIGADNFEIMKSFLLKVVNAFHIGANNVRIGMVTYSVDPHTDFQLNTYFTKEEVIQAIEGVSYSGGGATHTAQALVYVEENSFQPQSGSRDGVPKILMLCTDGTSKEDVGPPAQNLKDAGIEIFTIGVENANKDELDSIASPPLDTHVYIAPTFSDLDDIVDNLTQHMCESVEIPVRKPCCPRGWTRFSERNHDDCYISINARKTWADAESYCQFKGGHLASIHSEETNHFLKNLTQGIYDFPLTWVGGQNTVEACLWMWSDGSQFDYENWYSENSRDREDSCLRINYGCNLNKLKWSSGSCNESLPFVCAKMTACRPHCRR